VCHDGGSEFWNSVMKDLAKLLGIHPTKTTSHRPSANGMIERVHSTLHAMCAKLISSSQRVWHELAPFVTYAYNTAFHASTSFSPFYLLYMRHPRTPLELAIETPTEAAVRSDSEFVEETSQKMRQAHNIVREFIKTGFDRAKRRYDARVKAVQFKEGHFVWYFIPKVVKSKKSRWNLGNKGPYRAMKRINLVNYVIQRSPRTEPFVAHVDRLTSYASEIPACWRHSGDGSTTELPDRQVARGNTTNAAGRETQSPNVVEDIDSPVDRPVGSSGRQDRPVAGQKPVRNRPDAKCQRRRPSLELPANTRPPSPAASAHWHAPAAAE